MKIVRRSSFNIIDDLPNNIIDTILMLLPLRDAARTSILTKKWRYQWAKLPQLVFDDNFSPFVKNSRDILMKIYEILLLHQGPISKFTLDISNLTSCSEIDILILFLSRSGVQDFTLCMSNDEYDLPSYIFSCLELRHLVLRSCVFGPPHTFKGFSKLISLELSEAELPPNVIISNCPLLESLILRSSTIIDSFSIDAPRLKSFLFVGFMNCVKFINAPLLEVLSFDCDGFLRPGVHTFDLLKVFCCVPLIEHLHLDNISLKLLAVDNVPRRLPTLLNYIKVLELTCISFTEMDEFSCILCMIRSSPNLQKLSIQAVEGSHNDVETALEYLGMQFYSDISLEKLCEVELDGVLFGLRPELELIQFLLANSPALEKMYIMHSTDNIDMNLVKMLVEFTRFQRASQKAEIIFPWLNLD